MDILKIVAFGIVTAIIITTLRTLKPEIAIQASVVAGIIIFILVIGKLAPVIDLIKIYSGRANIDIQYLPALLKIIGIAYIVEFGAEICRDAGENAIASKIELAGKVLIAIMAIPIITSLLELVIKIMP
ncbi:MAG TPA: stage III sporulation protein AD [Clostridiaceae bacterium]|nr:stage III sporulation protein AD [Clostridiaceae bacterium]